MCDLIFDFLPKFVNPCSDYCNNDRLDWIWEDGRRATGIAEATGGGRLHSFVFTRAYVGRLFDRIGVVVRSIVPLGNLMIWRLLLICPVTFVLSAEICWGACSFLRGSQSTSSWARACVTRRGRRGPCSQHWLVIVLLWTGWSQKMIDRVDVVVTYGNLKYKSFNSFISPLDIINYILLDSLTCALEKCSINSRKKLLKL